MYITCGEDIEKKEKHEGEKASKKEKIIKKH